MMTRRKRAGKEITDKVAPIEEESVNERLPTCLFATDQFSNKRNNCYSSMEYLLLVRDVLERTEEMEMVLGTCFGKLFRLPVRCNFLAEVLDDEHNP
ncbi:unnamed protein product [Eruca vesicaria subsp. sativa]|uniref:Uncharacterized protein n=1 Tax=Eruca vesicaria subsp. sativa TaxID=29727 RepID=A0ABC8JDV8_ERUVS|nr:unnamed protein product [Eruca vesicaria subsp. sativa]